MNIPNLTNKFRDFFFAKGSENNPLSLERDPLFFEGIENSGMTPEAYQAIICNAVATFVKQEIYLNIGPNDAVTLKFTGYNHVTIESINDDNRVDEALNYARAVKNALIVEN